MKRRNRIVYLPLMGRIGNQLFEYAFAFCVQRQLGENSLIIVDTSGVLKTRWIVSLTDYNLPGVIYVDGSDNSYAKRIKPRRLLFKYFYLRFLHCKEPNKLYLREKKWQNVLNRFGVVAVTNGYMDCKVFGGQDYYLYGYFQSERFFSAYKKEIRQLFDLNDVLIKSEYPNINSIMERNTVCISIKIEHNLGSDDYYVCDESYYKEAISYICSKIEHPLFFICSDNVEKAMELFFGEFGEDAVVQAAGYSASITLCAMSKCKYFIINNTSFGWWAQYLCDYENKIVIAPHKWMNNSIPISIYDNQEKWHLI